jgi:hypothetical protein
MNQRNFSAIINLVLLMIPSILIASTIDIETARSVAKSQIDLAGKGKEVTLKNITAIGDSNLVCFYAVDLNPAGYIIVTADDNLPPVIAYSFQDNLDSEGKFIAILKNDIAKRLAGIHLLSSETIDKRRLQWESLGDSSYNTMRLFQQWPPEGTTPTGGWLETNWTQNPPYNQMCPIDPVTGSRSYAGCPATAMAQILNYHRTTNNTHFDDSDDYYHNYAGRTFWIDDDFDQHGFPAYHKLNEFLDTVNAHFQHNIPPSNQDKAAITFACGVAATQVYTSEGSGTFGVIQAFEAYERFGCNTIELLFDGDTSLYTRLADNIKDSLPAHLAIVDEAWSTGHNVVVDGYNTDNYFHVNFGWGGSNNGWYLLPEQMPYNLTVVEGLIVDIMKDESVSVPVTVKEAQLEVYPNPATEVITIETDNYPSLLTITEINGKMIFSKMISNEKTQLDVSAFRKGVYILEVKGAISRIAKLVVTQP